MNKQFLEPFVSQKGTSWNLSSFTVKNFSQPATCCKVQVFDLTWAMVMASPHLPWHRFQLSLVHFHPPNLCSLKPTSQLFCFVVLWFPKAYLKGMWLPCWCWTPFKWFHYQCNPTFARKQKHSSFGNFCRVDLEPLALLWADAVVWTSKYLKKHWMKHHDNAIKGRKPPQPEFRRPPNQETTANLRSKNKPLKTQPTAFLKSKSEKSEVNDFKKNTAQLHVVTESWRKQGRGMWTSRRQDSVVWGTTVFDHRIFRAAWGVPRKSLEIGVRCVFGDVCFQLLFGDIGFFLRSADCFPHLTFCCVFQQIWTFCLLFACFFASWRGCGMIWSWKGYL